MRFNKINRRLMCALSFVMLGFSCRVNEVVAASKDDKMLFKGPSIGALVNDYEEQAKHTMKIDNSKYPSYLKVRDGVQGYIQDYREDDVWGIRIDLDGTMYYAPNLSSGDLSLADKSAGVKKMVYGSHYIDNRADVYWNKKVKYSVNPADSDANKIGSFDSLKNFKPGYQVTNTQTLQPQWPKYPTQQESKIVGTKDGEGKHLFYGETVGNSNEVHSGSVRWKDSVVKNVVGRSVVRGEWRIIGANYYGSAITNNNFPKDQGRSTSEVTNYDVNWIRRNPQGGYNQSLDPNDVQIRENTFDRLKEEVNVGSIRREDYNSYFEIGAPASKHLAGNVVGLHGARYRSIEIPSEYQLDMALNRIEIKDGDKSIYVMKQETLDSGVVNKEQTSETYVKLQPGYEYTLEVEIKNRSDKRVYNPTFNVLGAVGGNATNVQYNLIDLGSKSPGYWVYSNDRLQEKKDFARSRVEGDGYFSVDGNRLKRSSSTNQKIVPALANGNSIGPGETKVIKVKFMLEGADKNSLESKFAVNNPNNVRIRLAGSINKKHTIADEVFHWGGINDSRVKNSIDNTNAGNDALGMNKAFYTQDMAIGGSSEFIIKDSKGNKVTDGEFMKGDTYSFGIKVKNPSGIWGTSNKSKVDYEIKDVKSGRVIKRGSAQGNKVLGTSDSEYVYFDVNIPLSASNQIQIDVELNDVHTKSKEDWYKDNNKFVRSFKAKTPVDLSIKEAMGDKIGDESSPSTVKVFAGETVGLKVFIESQVNYVVSPVEVKFSYEKDGRKISGTKNSGALDVNNPQTVVYPYVAPDKAGVYEVEVQLNPDGKVDEIDRSNNKHVFRIVVEDDVEKYASTSHVEGKKPDGSEQGNSNITVSPIYSSYTPSVTLQRRDKEYEYNKEKDEYEQVWGPWYDYVVEFRDKPLYVSSTESLELTEVKFKSKYTTDRRIEGKDTDLIDSQGFVNLVGGTTVSEKNRIKSLAKIKAGYGFEMEVKTRYETDVMKKYEEATSKGMQTKINDVSVNTISSRKVSELENKLPDSDFRVTSSVKFFPSPLENTINAKDQVLSVTMPDEKVYKSIRGSLIEKVSGGTVNQSQVYNSGATWKYRFKERDNGMDGVSRKYYLGNDVPNGKYHLRVGTSKLGTGGLMDIDNAYDGPGKPTRVYAAQDIAIEVYGGRQDDIKDNE